MDRKRLYSEIGTCTVILPNTESGNIFEEAAATSIVGKRSTATSDQKDSETLARENPHLHRSVPDDSGGRDNGVACSESQQVSVLRKAQRKAQRVNK